MMHVQILYNKYSGGHENFVKMIKNAGNKTTKTTGEEREMQHSLFP